MPNFPTYTLITDAVWDRLSTHSALVTGQWEQDPQWVQEAEVDIDVFFAGVLSTSYFGTNGFDSALSKDYFDLEFKYDKKEEVTLSDGGKVLISMKF